MINYKLEMCIEIANFVIYDDVKDYIDNSKYSFESQLMILGSYINSKQKHINKKISPCTVELLIQFIKSQEKNIHEELFKHMIQSE